MPCFRELTLQEMLADPIVLTVMTADNVDLSELESLLRQTAQKLLEPRQMTQTNSYAHLRVSEEGTPK
jgi:hypothetical protein